MLSKFIGIISYFPEDEEIRNYRKNKLSKLLSQISIIFQNIPIVIIAQNWNQNEVVDYVSKYKNLTLITHNKLGITGARKELRRYFLNETNFDYIILFDDDIELVGSDGREYLKQIDNNPDCLIEFTRSRHQLMAVSRYIYNNVDYDNLEPEKGDGFEDRIFYNRVLKLFPDNHKKFEHTGLYEHAVATADKYSTWYKNQDINKMLDKTFEIINNINVEDK